VSSVGSSTSTGLGAIGYGNCRLNVRSQAVCSLPQNRDVQLRAQVNEVRQGHSGELGPLPERENRLTVQLDRDQLQRLDPNLPLRTVPLLIEVYTPVEARLHAAERTALDSQWRAIEAWQRELDGRFSATERERSVADVLVGVRARR